MEDGKRSKREKENIEIIFKKMFALLCFACTLKSRYALAPFPYSSQPPLAHPITPIPQRPHWPSFTHILIPTPTHPPNHSLTHPNPHSLTQSLAFPNNRTGLHSLTLSFAYRLARAAISSCRHRSLRHWLAIMAAVLPSYTHSKKERLVVVVEASKQGQKKEKTLINTQVSTHISSITRFQ